MVMPLAHAVCLCLALAASAGEPRPLKDVVADLASADYKTREAASNELVDTKDFSLAQLEGALKDPALTPEQRLRLERAGFRLFKDIPHGALGVEFTGSIDVAEVGSVKKGFPSAATLKPGDVITAIDGESVTSRVSTDRRTSTVRALVVSHDPGDEVPVTVLRGGVPVKLTVKFGDFKDLARDVPGPNPAFIQTAVIDESEFNAAWAQRLKRTTGRTEPAAIDATSLRPRRDASWSGGDPIDLVDASNRARAMTGDAPPVTAGATPDLDRQSDQAEQAMNGGGWQEQRKVGGLARAFNGGARPAVVRLGNINDPRDLAKESDTDLAADRLRLQQWRMSFIQVVDQPGLDRAQRQQFRIMEEQILQQIAQLDREIERRKAARLDVKPDVAVPVLVEPATKDKQPDQKADKP